MILLGKLVYLPKGVSVNGGQPCNNCLHPPATLNKDNEGMDKRDQYSIMDIMEYFSA